APARRRATIWPGSRTRRRPGCARVSLFPPVAKRMPIHRASVAVGGALVRAAMLTQHCMPVNAARNHECVARADPGLDPGDARELHAPRRPGLRAARSTQATELRNSTRQRRLE